MLLAVIARASWVIQRAALVDAHAHFVRLEVIAAQKPHIIGGHHRALQRGSERDSRFNIALLAFATGTLQLKIVAARKPLHPLLKCRLCLFGRLLQKLAYLAVAAT